MPKQFSQTMILTASLVALLLGLGAGRFVLPMLTGSTPDQDNVSQSPTVPSNAKDPAIKRYQVPVSMSQPARGPSDALVTLIEWCDFESEACRKLATVLDGVEKKYGQAVRIVFRHYSPSNLDGQLQHEFAQAAHEKNGAFWKVQARLLQAKTTPTMADLERIATETGLDWANMRASLDDHGYASHVIADHVFAEMFDVTSIPAVFVNGRRLAGEPTQRELQTLIEDEIARTKQLVKGGMRKDKLYAELTKDGAYRMPTRKAP